MVTPSPWSVTRSLQGSQEFIPSSVRDSGRSKISTPNTESLPSSEQGPVCRTSTVSVLSLCSGTRMEGRVGRKEDPRTTNDPHPDPLGRPTPRRRNHPIALDKGVQDEGHDSDVVHRDWEDGGRDIEPTGGPYGPQSNPGRLVHLLS